MSIIDELRNGTPRFTTREDGTIITDLRPPTALHIRAANRIQELESSLAGVARAYQSIETQYQQLLKELDEKRSVVS